MLTKKQLGQKIKSIRKSKKITQEKLAEAINVDFGYISKLEVGQNFPSIPTLIKISDVLNVDIHEFFTYNNLEEIDIKKVINDTIANLPIEKQIYIYKFVDAIK